MMSLSNTILSSGRMAARLANVAGRLRRENTVSAAGFGLRDLNGRPRDAEGRRRSV
jgi:hypothetical protein